MPVESDATGGPCPSTYPAVEVNVVRFIHVAPASAEEMTWRLPFAAG
jgi:hypothetical protein